MNTEPTTPPPQRHELVICPKTFLRLLIASIVATLISFILGAFAHSKLVKDAITKEQYDEKSAIVVKAVTDVLESRLAAMLEEVKASREEIGRLEARLSATSQPTTAPNE